MTRYSEAIWRPTEKHGYGSDDRHLKAGLVIHSMEGSLRAGFGVLDGPRQASWHFSIPKTGTPIYQHVDTDEIAWTNGSHESNRRFWGIECEGRAGEALTEPQYQALLQVVRWLWATHQVGAIIRQATLWEHNEMTLFGATPTSCPSGRIPWALIISALAGQEDDMTDAEKAAFEALTNRVSKLEGRAHDQAVFVRSVSDETVFALAGGFLFSVRDMATLRKLEELGYGKGVKRLPDDDLIWKSPRMEF